MSFLFLAWTRIFSMIGRSFCFVFFVVCVSCLNFKCSGPITTKPKGEPLSVVSSFSYDLFNISTHKRCFSLLNWLISSPMKINLINHFALFGKNNTNSIAILLAVTGSILTLVNKLWKRFFSDIFCSWFLYLIFHLR